MKIKNLSFVDKFIHKIIPLLALIFLVVVVWFYVLNNPYRVKVGNVDVESPQQAEEKVRISAQDLDRLIHLPESRLQEMKVFEYTDDFRSRPLRTLVGKPQFDVPLGQPGVDPKQIQVKPTPRLDYVVVTPPPAKGLKATEQYGVLQVAKEFKEPGEKEQAEKWIQFVGAAEPRDVRVITVTGEFDFADWRRRLMNASGQNLAPIPEMWWRPMLAMTDVVLERQTRDPVTGQWGPVERIAPLPNASPNYREQTSTPPHVDPAERVQNIRLEQEQIRNEPPPPLTPEHPWQAPGSEVPLTPEQQKRITTLDNEIRALQERITKMGGGADLNQPRPGTQGPPDRSPAERTPPTRGGARGPPTGRNDPGAARPAPTPGGTRAKAASEKDRAALVEQLKEKLAERQGILQPNKPAPRIDDGRVGPPTNPYGAGNFGGAPVPGAPGNVNAPGTPDQVGPPPLDKVDVWAHDITAKPGMTYRYRLAISVVSPLYQRPLGPNQRKYYDQISLTTDFAQEPGGGNNDWSAPITLDGDTYFFVTQANSSAKNVTVQVWRLYGGMWRSKEFNVQPGDPIGGKGTLQWSGGQKDVDLAVGATVVDIDFDAPVFNQPLVKNTAKLLYLDTATNTLRSRTVIADKDDPRLNKFRSQAIGAVAESGR